MEFLARKCKYVKIVAEIGDQNKMRRFLCGVAAGAPVGVSYLG